MTTLVILLSFFIKGFGGFLMWNSAKEDKLFMFALGYLVTNIEIGI